MPGLSGFDSQHGGVAVSQDLILQVSVGIQADEAVGHVVVIVVVEIAVGVLIEEVDLGRGVLFPVDGGGGGGTLNDVAPPDQGGQGHDHENNGNGAVQNIAALFLLALLRLTGGLGIGLTDLLLTELLFSG